MFLHASGSFCTNYSSSDAVIVNIPIINAIVSNGAGGHYIEMSAQNAEMGFASAYRIYEGPTEQSVLAAPQDTGIDCNPLYLLPNQGITYRIEADRQARPPGKNNPNNVICIININLTSGNYAAVRPLKYSDLFTISAGLSSNAVIVP